VSIILKREEENLLSRNFSGNISKVVCLGGRFEIMKAVSYYYFSPLRFLSVI
jgi:hypothetical protein